MNFRSLTMMKQSGSGWGSRYDAHEACGSDDAGSLLRPLPLELLRAADGPGGYMLL